MPIEFAPATTANTFVRIALDGPAGSGKTLTALKIAKTLGGMCCVIDSERGSAKLYANHPDTPKPYHVYDIKIFAPAAYILAIDAAFNAGANVCIIDSLTPSWNGKGGVLQIADGNIRGWKDATPEYQKLVDKVTGYNDRMHIIATLRSKMEYSITPNAATGGLSVTKLGMAPIHRDELPYEFDLVGAMDQDHVLTFGGRGKSRFPSLDKQTFANPGADLGAAILAALHGEPA